VQGASAASKAFIVGGSLVDVYDSAAETWSTLNLPEYRKSYVSTVGSGDLVAFAGGYKGSSRHTDRVDIYNAATDAWDTGTLSVARSRMASVAVQDKIIFAGGWLDYGGNSSAVDIYDIPTGTWSATQLPTANGASAGAAVGSKAFFASSSGVDVYDVNTGTWSSTTLSQSRQLPAWAAVGNKVIFAGGYDTSISTRGSDVVDIYDLDTNAWSTSTLSQARWNFQAAVLGDLVFFGGGAVNRGSLSTVCTDVVDVYNASTGQWSTAQPLDVPRCQLAAISMDDRILFAGGDREYSTTAYSTVDVYAPEPATFSIMMLGGLAVLRRHRRK